MKIEGFEKVKVHHFNTSGYRATHVALIRDGKVYLGVAKTAPKDQFSKKLGRKIAIGRALHLSKVDSGEESPRHEHVRGAGRAQYSTPEELDQVLNKVVFTAGGVF